MDVRAQQERATERFTARRANRERYKDALARSGVLAADTPDRIAKRLDRLSRYYARMSLPRQAPGAPALSPAEVIEAARQRLETVWGRRASAGPEAAVESAAGAPPGPVERDLEKIINTSELLDIRYLDAGSAAGRAVGRVQIRAASGRLEGFGTGSLVTPRLLLTNHHVLPTSAVAAGSAIEFDFQDGIDGRPLTPKVFRFKPDQFWLADENLDFALVAVDAPPDDLGPYGFNRLIEAEGKAIIGEFVTIIQHPGGEKKQIALRENRIVDLFEDFLHYETDTQPGSSGSPVFNDQWEVVALHHASVPKPDRPQLGGFANEGIRVSRLLAFVRNQPLGTEARRLRDQLFDAEASAMTPGSRPTSTGGTGVAAPRPQPSGTGERRMARQSARPAGDGGVTVTVPLEITVRLGARATVASSSADAGEDRDLTVRAGGEPVPSGALEVISIDPDYSTRTGYAPDFLGPGSRRVPLPRLTNAMLARAAVNEAAPEGSRHVFPYHHFSLVTNRQRGLAYVTAVNIDGNVTHNIKRDPDRWFFDPRLPREEQTGEEVYRANPLDRGHLVRRLDPAWGTSATRAKVANDDTFHFTNCTPQHKDFNQNKTTWAGLEDYILKNADVHDLRVSVFTGPVLDDANDPAYRGVQLPLQFWKVVVMVRDTGRLSATAYLLSQEDLLGDLERAVVLEGFQFGQYKTFQVPVSRIEALTGLDFGSLKDADPLEGLEAVGLREVAAFPDIVL